YSAISSLIVLQLLVIFQGQLLAQGKYLPHSMRIGTDVLGIGTSIFDETRQRYELNADLAINKYFLVADVGIDNIKFKEENFDYANKGYYFRVGADVNFMPKDVNNN